LNNGLMFRHICSSPSPWISECMLGSCTRAWLLLPRLGIV
jgi:hypothetical protein